MPLHLQQSQPKSEGPPFDDRRRSQGGDSKYGFAANANYYGAEHSYNHSHGGVIRPHGIALPAMNGGREENGDREPTQGIPGLPNNQQYPQAPPYPGPRNGHPLSLPPNPHSSPHSSHSPHSPHPSNHTRQSPFVHPGRSPPKTNMNYPPGVGGYQGSPPSGGLYNGQPNQNHLGGEPPPPPLQTTQQPDLPPKINRASKPNRLRSSSQDRNSGQDFGSGKENDFSDNNYINTGRGTNNPVTNNTGSSNNVANINSNNVNSNSNNSLERQSKVSVNVERFLVFGSCFGHRLLNVRFN